MARQNRALDAAYRRLLGLVRKEFIQIRRDPSSLAIAFVMPLFLLLLFGYGISLDAKHVKLGLVVEKRSPEAAAFTAAFHHSEYFDPVPFENFAAAEHAMRLKKITAVVRLREDFGRDLIRHRPAVIQVIVDGVDANTARIVSGYVQSVWNQWLVRRARQQGRSPAAAVEAEHRIWYNSALRSRNYLVPGLIAVIMTLIGALLTAMVVAREWERGTMEALIAQLWPMALIGLVSLTFAGWLFRRRMY